MRDLRNKTLSHFLAAPGRFAVYGSGATGESVFHALAGCGLKPQFFIDSYRTGALNGLEIMEPEEALSLDAVVIAGGHPRDMTVQLRADGFEGPVLDLTAVHEGTGTGHHDEVLLNEAAEAIDLARSLLQDDGSRANFDAILAYRRSLDPGDLPPARPGDEGTASTVFDGEWVLDVGSELETILTVAESVGPLGRVHVMEPDAERRDTLAMAAAGSAVGARIHIHPFACGGACRPAGCSNDATIPAVVTIDEFVWEETSGRIDRVWIALAGANGILEGASATLNGPRPQLDVALHHGPSDLWELPIRLKEWVPRHRLGLSHHSQGLAGSVCHAGLPESAGR